MVLSQLALARRQRDEASSRAKQLANRLAQAQQEAGAARARRDGGQAAAERAAAAAAGKAQAAQQRVAALARQVEEKDEELLEVRCAGRFLHLFRSCQAALLPAA